MNAEFQINSLHQRVNGVSDAADHRRECGRRCILSATSRYEKLLFLGSSQFNIFDLNERVSPSSISSFCSRARRSVCEEEGDLGWCDDHSMYIISCKKHVAESVGDVLDFFDFSSLSQRDVSLTPKCCCPQDGCEFVVEILAYLFLHKHGYLSEIRDSPHLLLIFFWNGYIPDLLFSRPVALVSFAEALYH